jgi:hypothetical protein
MEWDFMVALVLAIPVILFPAAFIWYLNVGGIRAAIREVRARRPARQKDVRATVKAGIEDK